jgi:primosomal protein N'
MKLRIGMRVRVPWGFSAERSGTVVELWGDESRPSHVRVELEPIPPDNDHPVLLLTPDLVEPLATA